MIKNIDFKDALHDIDDAILNEEFTGFKQDYLILHSLLRKYRPASYFEIGTNMGTGLNIACNAIYKYCFEAKIYSLDLPTELAHVSLQHPISEGKGDRVGEYCKFPYIQLRGDSAKFNYEEYPCEAYFCDGEHIVFNVYTETMAMLTQKPKLIIWHDADMKDVQIGINSAVTNHVESIKYYLYRVTNTRIAYAIRKMESDTV